MPLPSSKYGFIDTIKPYNNNNVNNNSTQNYKKYSLKAKDNKYLEALENNNTDEVQKLVEEAAKAWGAYTDESGKPVVLYHQTENEFTVFDLKRKGAGASDDETPIGIFLKESNRDIGLKGKKQMPLYAQMSNPLVVQNRQELINHLKKNSTYKDAYELRKNIDKEYQSKFDDAEKDFRNFIIEWRAKNPEASRSAIYDDPNFDEVFNKTDVILKEWHDKVDETSSQAKAILTEVLKNEGYDSVILKEDIGSFGRKTEAYIVFENNQVKSADTVTYDNEGNVITLSERFKENNADIRYSIKSNHLTSGTKKRYNSSEESPLSTSDRAKPNPRSSINWVYKAELFSVKENILFQNKISEINQNSQAFEKNKIGEYMLPIENKIVFTDGNYDNPQIFRIIEVLSDYATIFEEVRRRIFNVEWGRTEFEDALRTVASFIGTQNIITYRSGSSAAYGWADGRRKGKNRRAVIKNSGALQNRKGNASNGSEKLRSEHNDGSGGTSQNNVTSSEAATEQHLKLSLGITDLEKENRGLTRIYKNKKGLINHDYSQIHIPHCFYYRHGNPSLRFL